MSVTKIETSAERSNGILVDTHPRANGELVLTPDDLMEGQGNFAVVDAQGDPEGWELVTPPNPDARNVYAGTSPANATRQNSAPLGLERSSYLVNHPLVDGDPFPRQGERTAPLPRPRAPIVKKVKVNKAGYPVATDANPHWIAFSWGKKRKGSHHVDHTPLGPPISFTGANGQSYRVTLPDNAPEGADTIGIWMALGQDSTATRPGEFFLQRDLGKNYGSPFYDLNGPYRFELDEPEENETMLPEAKRPRVKFREERNPCRIGEYYFFLTWARGEEEGLQSDFWGPFTVEGSNYYADPDTPIGDIPELLAGYGYFEVNVPPPPRDVTGYYLYAVVDDEINRVYNKVTGVGLTRPWPAAKAKGKPDHHKISGWGPGSDYDDRILLSGHDPAGADGSGIDAPDFRPEPPEAFGASRPEPGVYFFRTTDEHRGLESRPSEATEVELGAEDIARVIFRSPVNELPNATFVEKAADGLPLDHTIVTTGGSSYMDNGELVLETNGAQTGTTPSLTNEHVDVDREAQWELVVRFKVENPRSGPLQGNVEAVLEEIDETTNAITTTVLRTSTEKGEYETRQVINPASGTGFKWKTGTYKAALKIRFTGATKNAIVRVSRQLLKPYKWDIRRRKKVPGEPSDPNPPPETTHPPGSDVGLEPSPTPPESPEYQAMPAVDRPLSDGEALEATHTFETVMPAGWTENTSGGATISRQAAAALSGSIGLRLQKSTGGALGSAFLSKVFPTPAGLLYRHSAAFSTRNRINALSASHHLEMHKIGQPDGSPVAWVRYGSATEVATLTIDDAPVTPGNVAIALDGVSTNVAVVATREVQRLVINTAPTAPGTIGVTVGGVTRQINAGGEREQFRVEILNTPTSSGYHSISVAGSTATIHSWAQDSRAEIAAEYASRGMAGWNVTAAGRFLYFTSQLPGPRATATFAPGPTGLRVAITNIVQGVSETATELADRIRATSFFGWTQSGTGTTVDFTAVEGGPRTDPAVDVGITGATATVSTVTQGSVDTASALATRIRGTTFANWTTGGSGNVVTFTHTSAGPRQDAQFNPGATGTDARMVTTVQGALGDVIAYIRDRFGVERKRKIITGITSATIWNIDVAVMGAGTAHATIAFWGSTGSSAKTLLAYYENVDLTDTPVGYEGAGVWADSNAAATWTVHMDDLSPTQRGEKFYRTHDYAGVLLNQLHYHGIPTQPTIPGMPLKGFRGPVMAGETYSFSGFYRWDSIPTSRHARPTYITAYTTTGARRRLKDITGDLGLSGDGAWQELKLDGADAITIPNNCYLIGIESENVSEGTIVIQELVYSLGTQVKRTPLRATSGAYRATFRRRAEAKPSWVFYSEKRRLLETDVEVPANATAVVRYRAGDSNEGPWTPFETDPLLVPDRPFVEVDIQGTSIDSVATFVVRDGSPKLEYDVVMGDQMVTSFLKGDGSEFFGGALTIDPDEWSAIPDVGVNRLPGGALRRTKLFDGVEITPGTSIVCFTEEDKRYIEERCLTENFTREEWGESLLVALSGQVRFERQSAKRRDRDGFYKSVYVAQLPHAEVVERKSLR